MALCKPSIAVVLLYTRARSAVEHSLCGCLNRPQYGFCPSVRPVRAPNSKKGPKTNIVWTFPRAGVTGVPVESWSVRRVTGLGLRGLHCRVHIFCLNYKELTRWSAHSLWRQPGSRLFGSNTHTHLCDRSHEAICYSWGLAIALRQHHLGFSHTSTSSWQCCSKLG